MQTFDFQGLGTHWSVVLDAPTFPEDLKRSILDFTTDFEAHFSRFLPASEVNAFRESGAGAYPVSPTFALLLERASLLRTLTAGAYDPIVAGLLEVAGYGPQTGVEKIEYGAALPRWSVSGERLTIDGPVAFDFGGIGKGYAIDQVGQIVRESGQNFFLVDGGGDMLGTMKADGTPWRVAIEYPGKPDLAAGVIDLQNEGLAVSDRFRRRFGRGHHFIDVEKRTSTDRILGCAAVAGNAFAADCMTSGLALATPEAYPPLAAALSARYLVFPAEGQVVVSPDWQGELF
ncbi:MAG: FAD:protein FMN transferase [Undibacterium sp.]